MIPVPVPPADANLAETQWSLCLDALAAQVATVQQALRTERLEGVEPFPVPDSLPPLPRALVAEAVRVLKEVKVVERELELAQDKVRRQLHTTRRIHVATPAQPSLVEERA